jgi:uncharacterized Zn finger protein
MKQDHDHDPLAQAARRLLQDSEQFIDSMSAARLSAARRRAVAQLRPAESRWYVFRRRWPALAGAAAAAVLIALLRPRVDRPARDDDALDYATANDAAIYEDLEFYLWADELDPAGSPRSPS